MTIKEMMVKRLQKDKQSANDDDVERTLREKLRRTLKKMSDPCLQCESGKREFHNILSEILPTHEEVKPEPIGKAKVKILFDADIDKCIDKVVERLINHVMDERVDLDGFPCLRIRMMEEIGK